MAAMSTPLSFEVEPGCTVSALVSSPPRPSAGLVLAHGAGAGMAHPFMQAVADGLQARAIATLRYQFPYMERGSKRPDTPALAHATVRAAATCAGAQWPGLPLLAGGKSFGGRMTSQAQAAAPLPGVHGLVFLGFPLHPPEKPSTTRADHLDRVALPMLFIQGTRDKLADPALLAPVLERLGARATLVPLAQADHSFHVSAKSGRRDEQVLGEALDALVRWVAGVVCRP